MTRVHGTGSTRPPDVRSPHKISVLIDGQWHNQAVGCMVDAGVLCLREDGAWFLIPHSHYERVTFTEPLFESDQERAAFVAAAKGDPSSVADTPVGDLEDGAEAFWCWLRDYLTVEQCEAVEHAGVHPKDWQAAAECCIRAARGERDSRPFTTYPDLPR